MNVDKFLEQLNISKEDYNHIKKSLKREPNELELWLFSAMYSEHCGYRHSKKYLKKLPKKNAIFTDENAGGVRIGKHAILFKMESHNHPSAVEPFNGAATGIGGIIRDVLAMNARPIALLDSLKFGPLHLNKTKHILEGVVDGISNYGNCIGVPTLAGECDFDEAYTDNPLVNVMALGIAPYDKIKTSSAKEGKVILLLGSATMKDGIGGASFASKDLDEEHEENRISVQIADPLMEKKLIEATLEILDKDLAVSCQDCGAAGILSSTSEMAAKGDCGIELYLDKVHIAQANMQPYEIMLSETQERMMFCVDEDKISDIEKICEKYEIPFSVIGKTVKEKVYRLFVNGVISAEVPPKLLSDAPFVYVKPKNADLAFALEGEGGTECRMRGSKSIEENILSQIQSLIASPNFASKEWIYSQYDYTVGARTVIAPKDKGIGAIHLYEEDCFLGISVESKPHQVNNNPYEGTVNTVFDAAGKLIAAGFEPLGITNCLNFANPNDSDTMYQFTQSLKGMEKALKELKIPVCSGNVSFYNKTENYLVYPTPTICMIGLCKEYERIISNRFEEGMTLILIGAPSKKDAKKTNFKKEKQLKKIIENLNAKSLINSCLRVTKGGVFGAIFKGLAHSKLGFNAECELSSEELFEELQGRYLIGTTASENLLKHLKDLNSKDFKVIGKVVKKDYSINGLSFESERLYDTYQKALTLTEEN